MKKATILFSILLLAPVAMADVQVKTDAGPGELIQAVADCTGATEITCGEIATGVIGAASGIAGYPACTGLDYSACGETIYELCVAADDDVTVTMNYNHITGNDLDLFLLTDCDENSCIGSATGVSGLETIGPLPLAAGTYYVVVDGWNGNCDQSGHTVSIDCDSPCSPVSVDPSTWGAVKGQYR